MLDLGQVLVGTQATVRAVFTPEPGGTGVVSAVTWSVQPPTGATVVTSSPNVAISNPSSNVWQLTVTFSQPGRWRIRCAATAGLIVPVEGQVFVTESSLTS